MSNPSSFCVFNTLAAAQALASHVDAALGYPKAGVDVGGGIHAPAAQSMTTSYTPVIAKPDGTAWAYPVDVVNNAAVAAAATLTVGSTTIASLDATWTPTPKVA